MESRVLRDCWSLALLELCQEKYKQAEYPSTKSPHIHLALMRFSDFKTCIIKITVFWFQLKIKCLTIPSTMTMLFFWMWGKYFNSKNEKISNYLPKIELQKRKKCLMYGVNHFSRGLSQDIEICFWENFLMFLLVSFVLRRGVITCFISPLRWSDFSWYH